jgi:hypothetical protein
MLSSLPILSARNVEPGGPPVPTSDHVARRQDLGEAAAGGQAGRQHGQPIVGEVEPAQVNQRAEAARQPAQLTARHIYTRGSCASILYESVLRIHDMVWIRIRGSMPLTSGSGSCFFRH